MLFALHYRPRAFRFWIWKWHGHRKFQKPNACGLQFLGVQSTGVHAVRHWWDSTHTLLAWPWRDFWWYRCIKSLVDYGPAAVAVHSYLWSFGFPSGLHYVVKTVHDADVADLAGYQLHGVRKICFQIFCSVYRKIVQKPGDGEDMRPLRTRIHWIGFIWLWRWAAIRNIFVWLLWFVQIFAVVGDHVFCIDRVDSNSCASIQARITNYHQGG